MESASRLKLRTSGTRGLKCQCFSIVLSPVTVLSAHCQQIPRLLSGEASAVKKPRHFEVRKSSSQVNRMHFFPQKKLTTFLVVALKTQAANAVSPSNKTNKAVRYGNIFIRRSRQGGARAWWWTLQPGHLTWRALV